MIRALARVACIALVCSNFMGCAQKQQETPLVLVIHGGAGVRREDLTPEKEAQRRTVLEDALRAGFAVLQEGRGSLEAVQSAIVVLEDSPLFNAGRGAVLTGEGTVELDASLMDGRTLQAGAVAGVQGVRNPIRLCAAVMQHTPHVLMLGRGAEELARREGLRFEEPDWFIIPEQRERLEKAKRKSASVSPGEETSMKIGTVGAVALDRDGHLAAGTSTGGLVNKLSGRAGDSPIIGAGTYAENGVCAVSCTGHGEFFIRNVVAHDVAARIKYSGATLAKAADTVIHERLKSQSGSGGLIAVDSGGNIALPFNTTGMYRAWITRDGVPHVAIFDE